MDATSPCDVVIIGSGLAGLVVAIHLLDAAKDSPRLRVAVLEKEAKAGLGNSIKASSGINAAIDEIEPFLQDTVVSAGEAARAHLIEPLVNGSAAAVDWLRNRLEVDLTQCSQLGGHAAPRTHRPSNVPIGAEIMGKLRKAVEAGGGDKNTVNIITNARVTKLTSDSHGRVTGVEYEDNSTPTKETKSISATQAVVLATGGFAADPKVVAKYRRMWN